MPKPLTLPPLDLRPLQRAFESVGAAMASFGTAMGNAMDTLKDSLDALRESNAPLEPPFSDIHTVDLATNQAFDDEGELMFELHHEGMSYVILMAEELVIRHEDGTVTEKSRYG